MPYKKRSYPYKKRTHKSGKYSRMKKRSFAARVKKVILKTAETKFIEASSENLQGFHDLFHVNSWALDPYSAVAKGTGAQNRVGDEIIPRGMKVKLWLSNKNDRPNVIYRVIIGLVPRSINGTLITDANLRNYLFRQVDNGAGSNGLLESVNTENGFTVLKDKLYHNNNTYLTVAGSWANKEHSRVLKFWIKPKKNSRIVYTSTGALTKGKMLFFGVLGYDAYGTLVTDNIYSYAHHYRIYWKDP